MQRDSRLAFLAGWGISLMTARNAERFLRNFTSIYKGLLTA